MQIVVLYFGHLFFWKKTSSHSSLVIFFFPTLNPKLKLGLAGDEWWDTTLVIATHLDQSNYVSCQSTAGV
jgi:hypothetical protein